MENLFELLRAKLHWVLLVVCEAIALLLLFNSSLFHSFMGSSLSSLLMGKLNEQTTALRSYLSLRQENRLLLDRLAETEGRYLALQRQVAYLIADTVRPQIAIPLDSLTPPPSYPFITAEVIRMTHHLADNILTINRGSADGVEVNMGVASAMGIIGIVSQVGVHYAQVVPIINEDFSLSCMTSRGGFIGNLEWEHQVTPNQAILSGMPKHATLMKGDTIVTSGYSAIFPPGLMIGRLHEDGVKEGRVQSRILVDLACDFSRLHYVYIITERAAVEKPLPADSTSL